MRVTSDLGLFRATSWKWLQAMVLALGTCALAVGRPAAGAGAQARVAAPASPNTEVAELAQQVSELRAMVQQLQAQVKELQENSRATTTVDSPRVEQPAKALVAANAKPESVPIPVKATDTAPSAAMETTVPASAETQKRLDFLYGTTVNFLVDGYYGYNFNAPIGRVNYLRAYDVSSNAFSLNQADVVLENAPDPANGKRYGARLDLQYGQATETLQGNAANEPRPAVYRNIFQAYGTYVVPIGSGLTADFGKWASSLGMEGNYTKDQMNYSRSYWFDFLPFYHMGLRLHYQVNSVLGLNYWVTNGTQQTEPFNAYKDEMFGFVLQPRKSVNWTVNYYLGQEHPDFQFVQNGPAGLPTLQGTPFEPIPNPPTGKLHIFDSYVTWNATSKLTFALEGDDVIQRLYTHSAPSHTTGGAAYARYQITPKIALAARSEYLSDRGGLFTGTTQALKEATLTFEYKFSDNFMVREEWRRDWSNQPYFLTSTLGVLKNNQTTATIGLVWWFGGKNGAW